jgi:RNA polymerase sigma factor (sigma-70 family)
MQRFKTTGEIEAVKSVSCEGGSPRSRSDDDAARKRAAVETYARNETALRRTARRYSLCQDDADDALQRGLEILLQKTPSADPRELVKWTQTVVKHEALAIRRDRERTLGAPAGAADAEGDWISLLPSGSDGPLERAERREAVARSREALQALKPQELRALTLLAEGYSYAEIGEITSWSQTKINRCLAEGRERFRSLIARSEDGSRCAEMRPLISAFCDGEAGTEEVAVREHLRVCAHCRAAVRTYRAAPPAAAALAPVLPLHHPLLERLRDAFAELAGRLGSGKADAVSQVTAGGGASGMGAAALAKVAAVCIGTAGSAAACVATGLMPAPLVLGGERSQPSHHERQAEAPARPALETVEYEPAPEPSTPAEPKSQASEPQRAPEPRPAPVEPAAEVSEPASGGGVEYAPPPAPESAPEPAPAPVESDASGSPAGEFGP